MPAVEQAQDLFGARESGHNGPASNIFAIAPVDLGWHRAVTDTGRGAFLPITVWFNPQAPGSTSTPVQRVKFVHSAQLLGFAVWTLVNII